MRSNASIGSNRACGCIREACTSRIQLPSKSTTISNRRDCMKLTHRLRGGGSNMVETVRGGLPRSSKELLSRGLLAPTQIQLAAKVLVGWRPRQYAYQKSTWLQFLMSLCLTLSRVATSNHVSHMVTSVKQEINILSNQCSLYQCMHL